MISRLDPDELAKGENRECSQIQLALASPLAAELLCRVVGKTLCCLACHLQQAVSRA